MYKSIGYSRFKVKGTRQKLVKDRVYRKVEILYVQK